MKFFKKFSSKYYTTVCLYAIEFQVCKSHICENNEPMAHWIFLVMALDKVLKRDSRKYIMLEDLEPIKKGR